MRRLLTKQRATAIVAAIKARKYPLVIVLANLKGGTAKSTSVAFLAHRLHELGLRVKVVDADPQGSTLEWQGLGGWPVPVLGLPTATLHRQLWGVIDPESVDVILIDTPPLEEEHGIVASALRMATDIIIPMAPTMMELRRVNPVFKAIANSDGYRDDDPSTWIMFNRTVPNATSTTTIRTTLTNAGRAVLDTNVPRLELYAQAFGTPVPVAKPRFAAVDDPDAPVERDTDGVVLPKSQIEVVRWGDDPYGQVTTELLEAWSKAA